MVALLLAVFAGLFVQAQTPTVHSTNLQFSNVYCQQLTLSWTNGNGSQRIVVAREGAAVNTDPANDQFYIGSDTFMQGTKIGTDNFVIYNGSGSSVTLRGLKKNTTYHFAIFEFNGGGTSFYYYTSGSVARGSQTTENITSGFSIGDTYQCLAANNFNFTNSSSSSAGGSLTYLWEFGDKQTSSAKDPTHSYAVGGIFNVRLTVTSTGCLDRFTLKDTVVVPYITDFTLDKTIPGNDSIQCLDGNFFLFKNLSRIPASPIYGTYDAANYLWITGDGQSGNLYNANFSFKKSGVIDVKLYTRRKVAPKGDFCIDSIQKRYVVLPPPVVAGGITFSDTALCLNTNRFQFEHGNPAVRETTWYFGDGDSSKNNPAVHSYSSSGKKYIGLRVIDLDGCTATLTDSVEVFEEPDNYFSGLDTVYCLNDPIARLTPNLSGGRFDGEGVNPVDFTFNPNTTGNFEVYYIYTQGNCVDTFSIRTRVLDRPVFSVGPDTFFCVGQQLNVNPNVTGISYSWNDGVNTGSRNISSPGTYVLTGSDGKCSTLDTLIVRSIRPPSFSLGIDTTICGGQTVTVNFRTDEAEYIWSDGYNSPGGTRVIDESGFYSLTINNPCGSATDDVDINILPYACEIFVPNAFSPNNDKRNEVFRPSGFFEFIDMTIFNEYGELLFFTDEEGGSWDGTYKGERVPVGKYYFRIRYALPESGALAPKHISGPVQVVY